MAEVSEQIKKELKKPLGDLIDHSQLLAIAKKFKIIAVGDISTLICIHNSVHPFIAVFDFHYMRQVLDRDKEEQLETYFKKSRMFKLRNPAGTISAEAVPLAESMMRSGGVLKIDGEEDLLALVFIALAEKDTVVIYGQPNEGLVLVKPNSQAKIKSKEILKKLNLLQNPS
jgi:uncharacterized protein (UPF0218 family)